MDMVTAPTEGALDQAFTQLRGGLAERVLELRNKSLEILARLEVQIDFIDEDLGGVHGERPTKVLANLQSQVHDLAQTWHTGSKLRQGARIVLLGPPNAGKSSLFNALLRTSRAIVTPIPGTTRDYLEETADIGGIPVVLTDTAGLRDGTDDIVEQAGIERTGTLAAQADLVLVLTPCGSEESPIPQGIQNDRVMRVKTKSDLGEGDVSALTGDGLEGLIEQIVSRLVPGTDLRSTDVMVTHERHYSALIQAEKALENAYAACRDGEPVDAIAVDVQEAVYQLGLVVGETTTEDLLDRIFGDFCIGK
jgi:tRNA modification GTPase